MWAFMNTSLYDASVRTLLLDPGQHLAFYVLSLQLFCFFEKVDVVALPAVTKLKQEDCRQVQGQARPGQAIVWGLDSEPTGNKKFKALSCGKPLNTWFCCLFSLCVVLRIEPMALQCLAHAVTEVDALVCSVFRF